MTWETIERPGYFGKKRAELSDKWDAQFGSRNWRLAYEWNGDTIDREMALQLYEDGYYEHFKNHERFMNVPSNLEWITSTASDVYDTAPSNIGIMSYSEQETPSNHIHDVAIRRAVLRLGERFKGDHLVHVRWIGSEGYRVNPGVVMFHKPELIVPGEIKDYGGKGIWWNPNTIEDFYQRNKVLQVWK